MLDEGELTAYLDEHLDDPDAADVAGGIPDPVLAEIGAERTGAMREIVATIQAEQDLVIRAPIDQVLVVQGGPGTGKTAVALHRAAYLLFEHRRRLARDGVLVDRARTGRSSTTSATSCRRSASAACASARCSTCACRRSTITARRRPGDGAGQGRRGDARRARSWRRCSASRRRPTTSSCRSARAASCSRRPRSASGSTAPPTAWCRSTSAASGCGRSPSRSCAGAPAATTRGRRPARCARRSTRRGRRSSRSGSSTACCPGRAGKRRAWTAADQLLVDEANSILNGPPLVYGHVVVDEAQDHSAVALRVIGRRSPAGVDDARRRRRPVDDAGRPGALGRRVRPPQRRPAGRRATSPS